MSISTYNIVNSSKPFPDFIRNAFISINDLEVNKIYPDLGLKNCSEPIDASFDVSQIDLNKVIQLALRRYISEFNANCCLVDYKGFELYKISHILYVCSEIAKRLDKNNGVCKNNYSDTVLSTPIVGFDGSTVLYKAGTDVFKVAKHILEEGSKYCKVDLVSTQEITAQLKNLKVIFSSEKMEGAWDISTMSMRGIKSCMRWQAKQSHSLIGSIIDPYCGIIYLTNGTKTKYGSKMLFRALVRVIIPADTAKPPALMIDRLYSCFYKNTPQEHNNLDSQVKKVFVNFLQKKLPDIKIFDSKSNYGSIVNFYMPTPTNFNLLKEEQRTYKDTQISYTMMPIEPTSVSGRLIVKNTNVKSVSKKIRKK